MPPNTATDNLFAMPCSLSCLFYSFSIVLFCLFRPLSMSSSSSFNVSPCHVFPFSSFKILFILHPFLSLFYFHPSFLPSFLFVFPSFLLPFFLFFSILPPPSLSPFYLPLSFSSTPLPHMTCTSIHLFTPFSQLF